MAKISPAAWFAIGALIVIVSLWIGGKLALFTYVGLLFLVIGAFKGLVWYMTRKPESHAEHAIVDRQVSVQRGVSHYVNCPRCKLLTYTSGNYCHNCGAPLKTAAPAHAHADQKTFDPAAYLQRMGK